MRKTDTTRPSPRDTEILTHYDNVGWKIAKADPETKGGVDQEWHRREVSVEAVRQYLERGKGVGVQVGEVSCWLAVVDNDHEYAIKLAPEFLPATLQQAKGEEVSHYFYYSPELGFRTYKNLDNKPLIDLKASNNGAGHLVVVEPTIHPKKGPYRFVGGFNPALIAEVPKEKLQWSVGLLASAVLIAECLPKAKQEGGGGRHDFAMALAGYVLRNGWTPKETLKVMRAAWKVRGAPSRAFRDLEGIVADTADKLKRNEPVTGGRTLEEMVPGLARRIAKFMGWERPDTRELRQNYARSDLGNAERFVDMHGHKVRWCPARKAWLVYDGKRWAWDDKCEVVKLAHQTARSIHNDASAEQDTAKQKEITKFAISSQNEGRISGMLSQAKPYVAVGMHELDPEPWIINCLNGTLDLRSGVLRPHDPTDLITKLAPVEYYPDAACPRFRQFLKETLLDETVISFVKRYAGYTLTGTTRERIFAILWGSGKNGKTTLIELLRDVLGDHAENADVETILAKKYAGVGNDVAALKGARFVSCAEVERGRRLAESKVKQLTGRDTVTARFLFGEPFSFRPQFKLWLSTNNKPVIQGTDDAIWDRIRLVPFTQRFDGERQDPKLPEKLREELPGVLAWMVQGCLEWQEHGLGEPESIFNATQQYRTEMDTLAAFLDDRCVVGDGLRVLAETLYERYAIWCDRNGEYKEPQKGFVARMTDRGYKRKRETQGVNKGRYIWVGIGLRDDGKPPELDDDGSPSEPTPPDGSPRESRKDKPNTSWGASGSEPSEAKNQNLPRQNPREERDLDYEFTPFTRFTGGGGRRLTREQVKRVAQLTTKGMKLELAVSSVLGEAEGS